MRPHRLRLRAFGPFPDEVEVDLDALSSNGLFLLHGETGSGKTTLLDAIGFALYGRVPGVRGKTGRLRSDHADPGVRTEVQLEATLGGRRWRITRSPAQERPKARGSGTTTEQARLHLEELARGQWRSVSTRIDEAAAELDPLLGMSADQFFQVVLLPQGEFARFLRADSKERGELLQRLFATERFSFVTDWLVSRRVSTANAVATARQALDVLAARVAQVARVDVPQDLPAEWGAERLMAVRAELAAAGAAAAVATQDRDARRAAADEVRRLSALQQRRAGALQLRSGLEQAQAAHDLLGRELRAAARAAEISAVLAAAAEREAAQRAATCEEAAARALLVPVGLAVDSPVPVVRSAAEAARRRTGRLDALRHLDDALVEERALQERATGEAQRARSALAAIDTAVAVLPARRACARAAVEAARTATGRLAVAESRAGALAAAVREARGLQTSLGRLEVLREERVLARETLVSLREKEADLREARFVSMVAELADRLEDGAPCEVCGATSHPDPYEGAGEGVTRDDEDRARVAAEHAARQVSDVEARTAAETAVADGHRERLQVVEDELAALAATVDADDAAGRLPHLADVVTVDIATAHLALLAAAHTAATTALADLRAAAGGLAAATAELEAVEVEEADRRAHRQRLEADVAAAQRRSQDAGVRADTAASRLAAELEGAADLTAALRSAAAQVQACDAVLDAAAGAERAGAEAVRTAAAAVAAAHDAGFDDVPQAAAALRSAAWREHAERRRRAHDDERAAVEAALAAEELQDLPREPVDVQAAVAALEEADAVVRQAAGAEAAVTERVRALEALVPELDEAMLGFAPLVEQASQVRRLADLCAGGGANALKMTLTSFVLAARLEQVASVASARLLRMTQGRYSLVHTDGAVKGGARSGLGLLARDSWTGQDRDTSTLSGGETFLASLALALGLADVVQAEAGGTRIEALFVDEGFGTLDEDTLDEVMDVLDGLREGGRMVGLVSHVAELRARIPAQVRVRKTRRGSDVVLVGC